MEVRVNAADWKKLGAEDQNKVTEAIQKHFRKAEIVADAGAPKARMDDVVRAGGIFSGPCKLACDAAEAAAVAACAGLPGPAAAVCIVAAHAAGDACRNAC